jgi:hypothetical protein
MTRSIFIAGTSKVESPSKRQLLPSLVVTILSFSSLFAQSPPASPNRPWHSPEERNLAQDGKRYRQNALLPPSGKAWSPAELIDFAESHNPETRVSWQNAIAQGEALGIARSELFPLLSAAVTGGKLRLQRRSPQPDLSGAAGLLPAAECLRPGGGCPGEPGQLGAGAASGRSPSAKWLGHPSGCSGSAQRDRAGAV